MINKIAIHCKKHSDNITTYYFTKSKDKCLLIRYDKQWDFGKNSPSGAHFSEIEIHNMNSFIKDDLTEIKIEDVPEAIIDLLSFLKD
ncbi:MAG: hypothetical protein LBV72_10115 [Tannerella sp.]|jgi:hypothetical protein|nr:hypothetical protein [Tannerella sp.]